MAITILAASSVAIWLYLLVGRGGFWLSRVADVAAPATPPRQAPKVVAIVPARNEAGVVGTSLGALLRQDYRGEFSVILVDDQSDDGTAAARPGRPPRRPAPQTGSRSSREPQSRPAGPASSGR